MPDQSYNHDMSTQQNILFSQEELKQTIARLGSETKQDYEDKQPLFICILKGSFIFLDLVRQLNMPLEVESIKACCRKVRDGRKRCVWAGKPATITICSALIRCPASDT
jgi:hypoxanthine-guanine phosphoribosyltransferase